MESESKKAFVCACREYFSSGEKNEDRLMTGMELEHFAVSDDKMAMTFGESGGMESVLYDMKKSFSDKVYEDGRLVGLACDKYSVSLEPSCQIEISLMPAKRIAEMAESYEKFYSVCSAALEKRGYRLANFGYHPYSKCEELPLIPKERYRFMDRYFKNAGSTGINMMRATASTQVSLDYTSESDFARKFRAAYVISPILKYICDNSPVFEGEKNKKRLLRSKIWRGVDKVRCEAPESFFEKNFGYDAYADFLWNINPVFVPKREGHKRRDASVYTGNLSIGELWSENMLDAFDMDFIISMAFPDVRLKKYIELRIADSLPIKIALSYAALVKGLIYNREFTDMCLEKNIRKEDVLRAEDDISNIGGRAEYMGMTADEFSHMMFENARESLCEEEGKMIFELENFLREREK